MASMKVPKKYRGIAASNFALGKGHYPINNAGRARNALARIAQNGTPAQQKQVKNAVHAKYPNIQVGGMPMKGSLKTRRKKAI